MDFETLDTCHSIKILYFFNFCIYFVKNMGFFKKYGIIFQK